MQARTCGWEWALNGKKVARKKNGVLSVAHSPYLTSFRGPDLDPGSFEGCGIEAPMCHLVINMDMLGKRRSWLTEHRETVPHELCIRQKTQVHVVVLWGMPLHREMCLKVTSGNSGGQGQRGKISAVCEAVPTSPASMAIFLQTDSLPLDPSDQSRAQVRKFKTRGSENRSLISIFSNISSSLYFSFPRASTPMKPSVGKGIRCRLC